MNGNTVHHGLFSHPSEKKDTTLRVEVFSDLAYEFCSCVDIIVNQILKNMGTWCSDTVFFLVSKDYALSLTKTIRELGAVTP